MEARARSSIIIIAVLRGCIQCNLPIIIGMAALDLGCVRSAGDSDIGMAYILETILDACMGFH